MGRFWFQAVVAVMLVVGSVAVDVTRGYTQEPAGEEQVLRELDTLRHGLEDGVQQGDVEKLISFSHPEIVVTWQNGEVSQGTEGVRKFFDRMLTGPSSVLSKIVMKPMVVEGRKIMGDVIISYGRMEEEYYFREGGLHFTLTSRFSAWLIRDSGKLMLRGLHLSANVFDNPVQALMVQKARWECGVGGVVLGIVLTLLLCFFKRCKRSV